jgi:hypothetical protein
MSWMTTIAVRLFFATFSGYTLSMLLSMALAGSVRGPSSPLMPILLLLLPTLLMLVIFLTVPSWVARIRWENKWLPIAKGTREVPEAQRKSAVMAGLREITGVWIYPSVARERTRLYAAAWSKTLIHLRMQEPWAWELYALAWFALKSDEDAVDELRALLMESRNISDAAFDVGLSVLNERQADVDLAILLSQEGLIREVGHFDPERRVLLENVWLAAYARDDVSRSELLPHLTRLFLKQNRRDEVSGRIYLDAFISGIRTAELRREMRLVADVLARTGRSPEMTANLRALAGSGNGTAPRESEDEPSTILRAPASAGFKSAFPEDVDLSQQTPVLPKGLEPGKKTSRKAGKSEEAESAGAKEKSDVRRGDDRWFRRPWVGRAVVTVLILAGLIAAGVTWYLLENDSITLNRPPDTSSKQQQPKSDETEVHSELPYTLQVAALPTKRDATDRIDRLREHDLDPYYVVTQRSDARWFRVRFGHFATTRSAQRAADSLRTLGIIDEYFVATFESGTMPAKR